MLDPAVQACANRLGARRAFYTSRDTADDLEAVRQSLGLDKISLYGVSYGTFTALTYARRYPAHVEALVLDSVIHPDGRDPLDRSTFTAFRRMLRDVCKARCAGITRDPVKALTRLVRRLQSRPLQVAAYAPSGKRLNGQLGEADVVRVLEGSDFDPFARAEIPAALVSASRGDGAPLARLLVRQGASAGTHATLGSAEVADSSALYFATACEELPFPWSRTAPLSARGGQLAAALAAVPASVYSPFSRQLEASTGTSRPCLRWPHGSPDSPLVTGAPADVPALILGGVDDTRTPLADARRAASLFPKATLVAVPHTGHSVLGTDLSNCSQDALASFFTIGSATQCPRTAPLVSPTRLAPTSLGSLRAPKGVGGKRGKTVAAVAATLSDGVLQGFARAALGAPVAGGGLRGGRFDGSLVGSTLTLRLRKVVYVPGVVVSGTARIDLGFTQAATAKVSVAGRAAAKGTLDFRGGGFKGRLDGRAVQSGATAAAAAFKRPWISWRVLQRLRRSAPLRHAARLP
jgi:pimeloyl-ACP methyl ester carboxylesterase